MPTAIASITEPGHLAPAQSQQIRAFFATAHGELERMLADTSRFLSGLTDYAADLATQLRQDEAGRFFWRWDPRFPTTFGDSHFEDLEQAVAGLSLPTLVVHGAQSEIVGAAEIARLRELAPAAEVVQIEGEGPRLSAERFDAFDAALLEFLERRNCLQGFQYQDSQRQFRLTIHP